jgi:hypothetical protein
MSGGGAIVSGVIGLILCAGSVVAAFLNKATRHPNRFIFFLVIAALFLIASVFVLLRGRAGGAGTPPTSA